MKKPQPHSCRINGKPHPDTVSAALGSATLLHSFLLPQVSRLPTAAHPAPPLMRMGQPNPQHPAVQAQMAAEAVANSPQTPKTASQPTEKPKAEESPPAPKSEPKKESVDNSFIKQELTSIRQELEELLNENGQEQT